MDASFRPLESWLFPDAVLARFAPKSCSGFAWGPDGLMYASGHDRPEVYALRLPKARSEEHTSELQSLMRISYAVFCLKKTTKQHQKVNKLNSCKHIKLLHIPDQ